MPVSTDPVVLIITALLLWGFLAACYLHDARARRVVARSQAGAPSSPIPLGTGPVRPHCWLCGGAHDYDDCPLEVEDLERAHLRAEA